MVFFFFCPDNSVWFSAVLVQPGMWGLLAAGAGQGTSASEVKAPPHRQAQCLLWCRWLRNVRVCRAPCLAAQSSHENPALTLASCPSQHWEAAGLPNTSLQSILVSALTVPTCAKFDIGFTTIGFLQCLKIASDRFCKSRRLCVCVCCVSVHWQGYHHKTLLPSQ